MIFSGKPTLGWYMHEVGSQIFTYGYLLIPTVLVFTVFGYRLGRLADKLNQKDAELERLNIILENQSITDDLTGLFNHRHILVQVNKEVERSRRYHRRLSGMMIDIDDFKSVNDLYGHLTGDSVIREMAELIGRCVRNVDIIGRFGGDEFLVILPEADEAASAIVSNRLLTEIRKHPFKIGRDTIELTASIGVFTVSDPKDFDKLSFVDRIDQAMFTAKERGKNVIYVAKDAA